MDEPPEEPAATDLADAAGLGRAVAAMADEVRSLADRVARLSHAVDDLGTPRTGKPTPAARAEARAEDPKRKPERFRVVIAPVAELALAAVAETSLRALDPVRRVLEVSRSDAEARFEIEIDAGADLVEPLRTALPVPFEVVSVGEDELVIALRPMWGPTSPA